MTSLQFLFQFFKGHNYFIYPVKNRTFSWSDKCFESLVFHNRFLIKKKKTVTAIESVGCTRTAKKKWEPLRNSADARNPLVHSETREGVSSSFLRHARRLLGGARAERDTHARVRRLAHRRGTVARHPRARPRVRIYAHGSAHARRCPGDSAICYCSARASILETASTPQPLSWSLQILTTRRRNWRDIWNLGSFQDTHLLLRVGPTLERVGLNSFLVSSLSLVISCRIEHRDFCATWKASLSRSRAVLLSYG